MILSSPAGPDHAGPAAPPTEAYHVPRCPRYRGPNQLDAWRAELAGWAQEMDRLARAAGWLRWYTTSRGLTASTAPAPPGPAPWDAAAERWTRLRLDYRRLRRDVWPLGPGADPAEPLAAPDLWRWIASALHPEHRQLLREVLRDLLTDDMADVALAVAQEVARP